MEGKRGPRKWADWINPLKWPIPHRWVVRINRGIRYAAIILMVFLAYLLAFQPHMQGMVVYGLTILGKQGTVAIQNLILSRTYGWAARKGYQDLKEDRIRSTRETLNLLGFAIIWAVPSMGFSFFIKDRATTVGWTQESALVFALSLLTVTAAVGISIGMLFLAKTVEPNPHVEERSRWSSITNITVTTMVMGFCAILLLASLLLAWIYRYTEAGTQVSIGVWEMSVSELMGICQAVAIGAGSGLLGKQSLQQSTSGNAWGIDREVSPSGERLRGRPGRISC